MCEYCEKGKKIEEVESGLEITEILTHEQYKANCYKVNKTPTK